MKNRFYVFNIENNKLLTEIAKFLRIFEDKDILCTDADRDEMSKLVRSLIFFGEEHGFYGNLWQGLVTHFLLTDENAYTKAIERKQDGDTPGAYELALHDIEIIMKYYHSDFKCFDKALDMDLSCITNYKKISSGGVFNESIRNIMMDTRDRLNDTKDPVVFMSILDEIYKTLGIGDLGLHKAFRITNDGGLLPINKIANVHFDDLIGLSTQKKEIMDNTLAFIEGRPANNCLLYGDAGTGKSSCIKALINQYFDVGLRIVEIYKHELKSLNNVIANLKGRNYKFILYMDDLSFEEFETEYKYLKALIEGGLEKKPDNVLIYATSNRRHLVRESFADRNDDIHRNDTMQEKLSLFGRFGLTIFFGAPDKKEYSDIVLGLKKRLGVDISDEELLQKANAWEVSHGGRSGRSATQLLDYILSKV